MVTVRGTLIAAPPALEVSMLKNIFWICVAIFSAMAMTGCESMNRKQKGALAGAAAGGAFGGATKGTKGAVIGAAAGAAAGGLLGTYLDKRHEELKQVVETEKTDRGLKVTLKNDVLFDFDQNTLKPEARSTLSELADILGKYPQDDLRIAGYTDHLGPATYNQRLSESRAHAVKDFLGSRGVENQMKAVGLGEIPGTGEDPAIVAQNRKVEIFIDIEPPVESR
jgi:outer membrane protein OmpA-like peptidoglycan-associated protein